MHTLNKLDGNPNLRYVKINNILCHIKHIVRKRCYVSSVQYKSRILKKCWMYTIEMSNVHNTNLEYIQYTSWIPNKCQMCTIEMLNVHSTNVEYMQYKSQIYVNALWWPQLHMYITINIYDCAWSSKLSLFDAICGSPSVCKRKIKIHYQISYL